MTTPPTLTTPRATGATRARRALVCVGVAAALSLTGLPASSVASTGTGSGTVTGAATGTVTGTVTGEGLPVTGPVRVTAYRYDDATQDWSVVSSVVARSDGSYTLPLEAGEYGIGFTDTSGSFAPEYYDDASDLDGSAVITVDADASAPAPGPVDADLAKVTGIAGYVTADGAGADAFVVAHCNGGTVTMPSWTWCDAAQTDSQGWYNLPGLPPGTYRLEVLSGDGTYADEFYNDATSVETALDVVVPAPGVPATGRNVALARSGPVPPVPPSPPTNPPPGPQPPLPPVVSPPVPPTPPVPPVTPPVTPPGMPPVTPPVVVTPGTPVDAAHKPRVKGRPTVGSTVRAVAAAWAPAGAKVTYQWLANGRPVPKADGARLRLTRALKGKRLALAVVATSPGHLPARVVTRVGRVRR